MLRSLHLNTNLANLSDIRSCYDFTDELIKALSFIPFGLAACISCAILIIAILRDRGLRKRKEICAILALTFADFIEAFATLIGGLYRSTIVLTDAIDIQFTPLQCMALPHSWLWRWSDFATSFMLLVLSIDRLLSVALPVKYMTWGVNYSRTIIGIPYSFSLFLMLCFWITPLTSTGRLSILCPNIYLSLRLYSLSKYASSAASCASIILYIPILIIVRKQIKRIAGTVCVTQSAMQRNAQTNMTIAVAISCVATFFLDVIPMAVGIFVTVGDYNKTPSHCVSNLMMLFHLSKVNAMLNLLIYYKRNKEIRASVRQLFGFTGSKISSIGTIKL